jgi:hypothetical protein
MITIQAFITRPMLYLCVAAAVANSCTPTEPNSDAADHLQLTVRLSRTVVIRADSLTVTILAFNRSGVSVPLDNGPCIPLAFEARSATGARVGSGGLAGCGFVGAIPRYSIAPGDSLTIRYPWSAVSNYGGSWRDAHDPLPAGTYFIVAGLVAGGASGRFVKESRAATVVVSDF